MTWINARWDQIITCPFWRTEGLLKAVMKDALDVELETPIKRITWNEAMDRFGSDKPDRSCLTL